MRSVYVAVYIIQSGLRGAIIRFLTPPWKVDHNDNITFIFAPLSPPQVEIESVLLLRLRARTSHPPAHTPPRYNFPTLVALSFDSALRYE